MAALFASTPIILSPLRRWGSLITVCLVDLLMTYRLKLKSAKLEVKTAKRWTQEKWLELQPCPALH